MLVSPFLGDCFVGLVSLRAERQWSVAIKGYP